MAEWSKALDSKSSVPLCGTVGSNPTPSFLETQELLTGEVAEWSKAHGWNPCVPFCGTVGSNPTLSVWDECPRYLHLLAGSATAGSALRQVRKGAADRVQSVCSPQAGEGTKRGPTIYRRASFRFLR
jgi:hypothetical protein